MMKASKSLQLKEMLMSMEENFKKSFIFSFLTYFTKLGKFLAYEKNNYANNEVKQKFKEIYQNSNFIIKWWFKFYINPNDQKRFNDFVSNQQLSPTDSLEHQNHHHITQEQNESEKSSDVAPQALTESSNEPFENIISLYYFTQAQITKALNILENESSNDIDSDKDDSSFDMRLDSKHPINSESFESELALQVSNNSDFPTPENQETSKIEIKNILNELITSCEMSTTKQTQRPTTHKNNKAQFPFQEESLMNNECKITLASLFTVKEESLLVNSKKMKKLPPPPPTSFF